MSQAAPVNLRDRGKKGQMKGNEEVTCPHCRKTFKKKKYPKHLWNIHNIRSDDPASEDDKDVEEAA